MDGGITEILALGSLVTGVVGGISSGIAQKQSADYQAQVARNNQIAADNMAKYDIAAGAAKAQDEDLRSASQIGKVVAGEAASGLDIGSGSQKAVISSTQEMARLNTLRTADNAQMQAIGHKNQAKDYGYEATLDTAKGANALTSSLISTASSVGDKWSSFQQKGLLTVPSVGGSAFSSSYGG